jgi:hypothetical protein
MSQIIFKVMLGVALISTAANAAELEHNKQRDKSFRFIEHRNHRPAIGYVLDTPPPPIGAPLLYMPGVYPPWPTDCAQTRLVRRPWGWEHQRFWACP